MSLSNTQKTAEEISWNDWFGALRSYVAKEYSVLYAISIAAYGSSYIFQPYYDDGLTPEEAWSEYRQTRLADAYEKIF